MNALNDGDLQAARRILRIHPECALIYPEAHLRQVMLAAMNGRDGVYETCRSEFSRRGYRVDLNLSQAPSDGSSIAGRGNAGDPAASGAPATNPGCNPEAPLPAGPASFDPAGNEHQP